jgi:starvation-inducible DNA-binding protein
LDITPFLAVRQPWHFKCFSRNIARHQRLKDSDNERMAPRYMFAEVCEDKQLLAKSLRSAHELYDEHNDVATTSLIEN